MWRTFLIVLLSGLLATMSAGQALQTLISANEQEHGHFGHSISGVGDVNGDGYPDIIVGALYESPGSSPLGAGRAYILDGTTGDIIRILVSPNEEEGSAFGASVSGAGDVNRDGYADVIVGASWEAPGSSPEMAGRAYIFDGQTGMLLHTLQSPGDDVPLQFGNSVSRAGDVNGDGYADVVVGAFWQSAGRAYVFNGQTGVLIHTLASPEDDPIGQFGYSVSGAGDVDGNGYDDIIVGAWSEDPGSSPVRAGRAYLFDGCTGSLLYTLASPNEERDGFFGRAVSGAGDTNGDGYSDVIIGAERESTGRAYVFDGPTGSVIHALESPIPYEGTGFGSSVSCVNDINGDGCSDIVVGAHAESPVYTLLLAGRAYVFDGLTGSHLGSLVSPNQQDHGQFGNSVSGVGDTNGDGYPDILVAAYQEKSGQSPPYAGRAYVFSGELIPTQLSAFHVSVFADYEISIAWRTETEHQCRGFYIERQRAGDAERYRIADQLFPSGGTASVPHVYEYVDEVSYPGRYAYWLIQVADDGAQAEYGPEEIDNWSQLLVLNGPHPNPVIDETVLELALPVQMSGLVRLRLYDISGRQIGATIEKDVSNTVEILWNAAEAGVASGIYWWQLHAGGETITRRMIVIR